MTDISRLSLFGKLNSIAYKSIESATVFCKLRGNPYVELVHWIQQIVSLPDSDMHRIIKNFHLDLSVLSRDLTNSLDSLPRGASSIADFSGHIEDCIERGWLYGSLVYGDSSVRIAYLVLGALKTRDLKNVFFQLSPEFKKIKVEELSDRLLEIVSGSVEDKLPPQDGTTLSNQNIPGQQSDAVAPALMGRNQALEQYTTDLTDQARDGKLDPILGRDDEIRQLIDILMRRRQNNPILTGEAGVGKTAVVEGFAHRIVKGDIPPALQGVKLKVLDIGLLQAGASMKGEFENRLKQVIEEVKASTTPIIMFIDETHTLIGAGGAAGTGDAANLLKPALARGELRTIGATTWAEYKKHIEKDPALTRRFQVVKVEEPSEEKAIMMLRNMSVMLEKHHHVEILDEAVSAAVKLSHRYIPARQLPDKAVSLLDTAAARVAVSQFATPAALETIVNTIHNLEHELTTMQREAVVGFDHAERISGIEHRIASLRSEKSVLEEKWQEEKTLIDQLIALKRSLRAGQHASADHAVVQTELDGDALHSATEQIETIQSQLSSVMSQLSALQGETPLVYPCCDEQAVAAVVADWTGIPVGRMVSNELNTVLNLTEILNKRVIGQDHAMAMIAKRIQTSRAGLDNPNKPIGVFMLCGPSGVGKTETALALGEALYGGEQNVITINMSEFQEAHTVSTLKGAPPGYVGYGEGGILTEAVRRKPYSVVLLDEVEKAHPDVHEIFFQVFDKGIMEDGEGRLIDFKNTLILLTSNVGSDLITSLCKDPDLCPEPDEISKALRNPLLQVFPAALLGRIVTIPYYPLSDDMLGAIIRLQLDRIKKRIDVTHGIEFTYSEDVVNLIRSRCTEMDSGGRMIDSILTNTLLPEISNKFLSSIIKNEEIAAIEVSVADSEFSYNFTS